MKNKPDTNKKGVEGQQEKTTCNVDIKESIVPAEADADNKTCSISPEEQVKELQKLQEEMELLRKAATERDEFLNLLQRVQADFLNYQKRIKKEKECWDKYQDENLLRELLPALGNFDRTLKIQSTSDDARCIRDGVELIKREIFRILEKRGLKQIETTGKNFDANIHEAVEVIESLEHQENEIIEEISPGFMLHDRLVRAAKVKIAAKPKQEKE